MRLFLTTAVSGVVSAFVLVGGNASASSITAIGGTQSSSPSIVVKHCNDCGGAVAETQSSYTVPLLERGTQRTEIVEIGGVKKLARTEAWLGGSPVVYVSKVPTWMTNDKLTAKLHVDDNKSTESGIANSVEHGDGVDIDAKTSAVEQSPALEAVAVDRAPKPLPLESFDLRLSRDN
jgi:hypothetical protein